MIKRPHIWLLAVLAIMPVFLYAHVDSTHVTLGYHSPYADTAIYQGLSIKLDLGNTALTLGTSKLQLQSYEAAINVRLKNRFYPTIEGGYAFGQAGADGGQYKGHGGFGRIGLDISPLKKHPEYYDVLLVGVRIGTALQHYDQSNVVIQPDGFWSTTAGTTDYTHLFRADAWGEVVLGCQVHVIHGFQMGWYVRMRFLMTRTDKKGGPLPYYIPGFGYRDDTQWGLNYYIGYKF